MLIRDGYNILAAILEHVKHIRTNWREIKKDVYTIDDGEGVKDDDAAGLLGG